MRRGRQISADSNGWREFPGAVGGGLRMNAGAMGAQTFENVARVRYLDAEGNPHTKNRDELEVHYRRFPLLENNFAISATFRAQPAERAKIDAALARITGETTHNTASRQERRLHFQESRQHSRGKTGG